MTRETATPAGAAHRCDTDLRSFCRRATRGALRGVGGAALLLALAVPAKAQSSNVVAYRLIDLQYNQFPATWVDWTLGAASGTLTKTTEGTQVPIAPLTSVGSVAAIGFRDVASNQTICRIEVELSGPSQCTPRLVSTGCSITLSAMVNNACMVVLRHD